MIVTAREFTSEAEMRAAAAAVHARCFSLKAKPKLALVPQKVVNLVAQRPLWQRAAITFDMHVMAWHWHLANRKTAKHLEFIRVRSIELGYGFSDIVGSSRDKHIVRARQQMMYELRDRFKLSYPHIGRLMNKDHTSVIAAVRKYQLLLEGKYVERHTKLDRLRADVEGMQKGKEMYEVGHSIEEIARFLRVKRDAFVAIAKEQGWYNASRASTRAYNFQAMRRDYEAGMPIKDLAAKYDISERTWYFMRTKMGIPNRGNAGKEKA